MSEALPKTVLRSFAKVAGFNGVPKDLPQLCQRKWLGDVVEDVHFERRAHVFVRRVAGDHDDASTWPTRLQLFEDGVSSEFTHFDVGELLFSGSKEINWVRKGSDREGAFVLQNVFHVVAEVEIVIEDCDID